MTLESDILEYAELHPDFHSHDIIPHIRKIRGKVNAANVTMKLRELCEGRNAGLTRRPDPQQLSRTVYVYRRA